MTLYTNIDKEYVHIYMYIIQRNSRVTVTNVPKFRINAEPECNGYHTAVSLSYSKMGEFDPTNWKIIRDGWFVYTIPLFPPSFYLPLSSLETLYRSRGRPPLAPLTWPVVRIPPMYSAVIHNLSLHSPCPLTAIIGHRPARCSDHSLHYRYIPIYIFVYTTNYTPLSWQ